MSIREMLLGPEKTAAARQGQQVVGASDGVLGAGVNVQSGSTLRGAPTGTPVARTPVRQMLAAPQMSQQPPVARQGTQVVGASDGVLGSGVNVRSGTGLRGSPAGTPVAPADRVPVRPAPMPSPAVAGGTNVLRQQMPGGAGQAPMPSPGAPRLPAFNGASARAELGKLRASGSSRMGALQPGGGAQTAPASLAPLTGPAASGSLRNLTGGPSPAAPGGAANGARGVFAGMGMTPRAAPAVGANTEQGRFASSAQAVKNVPGMAGPAAVGAVNATQRQYDSKMGVGTAPSADLRARPSIPPGMQRSLPTAPASRPAYSGVRLDSAGSGYPGAAPAASRIPAQPPVPAPPPAAPKLPTMGGGSGGVTSAPKAPTAPKPAVNSAATQAPKLAQPTAPKAA